MYLLFFVIFILYFKHATTQITSFNKRLWSMYVNLNLCHSDQCFIRKIKQAHYCFLFFQAHAVISKKKYFKQNRLQKNLDCFISHLRKDFSQISFQCHLLFLKSSQFFQPLESSARNQSGITVFTCEEPSSHLNV